MKDVRARSEKIATDEAARVKMSNEKIAEYKEDLRKNEEHLKESTERAKKILNDMREREEQKAEFRRGITGGADYQSEFLDILDEYLAGLSDDNRRIEACSNVIKHCRAISIKLQVVK